MTARLLAEPKRLLSIRGLKTHFRLREGVVRAVDGVDLDIDRGQTLGLIGESGCGKSVLAQSILRILPSPPAQIVAGEILYRPKPDAAQTVNLAALDARGQAIRQIRGKHISMIFQEPMTSLGPLNTIGDQISEAILLHEPGVTKKEARQQTIALLRQVGIPRPEQTVDAYPHQLSGGMRQRAMIAMALSCRPSLLIADEPTTALDVTVQAQILDLLRHLRAELGMSVIFITHNLGMIAEIADEVAVMYLGRVVERAKTVDLFRQPRHPYTQGLLDSIPRIDEPTGAELRSIEGSVPDPFETPTGCPFSNRCPKFMPGMCDQAVPALTPVADSHWVRCYLYSDQREAPAARAGNQVTYG